MCKTGLPLSSAKERPSPQPDRPRREKTGRKPKVNIALDKVEVTKMIAQIREEVEFHRGCAAEIKAKMEKLSAVAFAELLKVKELKNIVESLKNNGRPESPAAGSPGEPAAQPLLSPPAGQKERRKQDLDRELEKLLIIKRLLETSLPQSAEKSERPVPPGLPGKKRILVVDDDPTTVKIIAHFLAKEEYLVSSSQSGVEGLKKAFQENPALILLDIMMPDLNGFQFLSIYRRDEENARVPVVILSSLAEEADILKGLEIGAADYITKPFSPQVLLAKIKKNIHPGP